ncbi:MAG: acyl-CoA dehydrogenase C-terminal domain-containing protein, partial [Xanthobacteraceae bacterium]
EVTAYIKERGGDAGMAPFVTPLSQALGELQQATMWFLQNAVGNPDNAGAGATDYMHLFGLVALGYMWCLIAEAAKAKTGAKADAKASEGDGAVGRMAERLTTGRFFMERMLPGAATHLARIKAGAASTMELPAEAF